MACEVYATLDDAKTQLKKTTAADDVALLAILEAATKAIDTFCNRPDGFVADAAASARIYTTPGGPTMLIDECVAITLVAVKDSSTATTYTSWDPGDWIPFTGDPRRPEYQPLVKGIPYTAIMVDPTGGESYFTPGTYSHLQGFRPTYRQRYAVPTVQVTARWGYSDDVPEQIRQACIVQASRWFRRGLSQWSDTIGSPAMGQLFYRKPLDPAVEMLLTRGGFKRARIG